MSTNIKQVNNISDLVEEPGKLVVVAGKGVAEHFSDILSALDHRLLAIITTGAEIEAILKKAGDRNAFLINASSLKEGLMFGKYAAGEKNSVCFLAPHYFSEEEKEQNIEQVISECNNE